MEGQATRFAARASRSSADTLLALSGIMLEVSPAARSAPARALADLLRIVPTARREFEFPDRVTAFVRIVRAASLTGPTAVVTRIRDAQDRVAFERQREMTGDEYTLELPIDTLAPGEHLLEVRATSGPNEATERLRFRVR